MHSGKGICTRPLKIWRERYMHFSLRSTSGSSFQLLHRINVVLTNYPSLIGPELSPRSADKSSFYNVRKLCLAALRISTRFCPLGPRNVRCGLFRPHTFTASRRSTRLNNSLAFIRFSQGRSASRRNSPMPPTVTRIYSCWSNGGQSSY
jgi:hypothetical protein